MDFRDFQRIDLYRDANGDGDFGALPSEQAFEKYVPNLTFLRTRGDHMGAVMDPDFHAAAARHFTASCTTDYRAVAPGDAPEQLPRLDMWYFQHPEAVANWGTPAFVRRIAMRRALRRVRGWWSRR